MCHCPLRQPVHRAQSRVCIEAGHVCLCNRRLPLTFLFGLLQMLLALSSVPPIGLGHGPPPPTQHAAQPAAAATALLLAAARGVAATALERRGGPCSLS